MALRNPPQFTLEEHWHFFQEFIYWEQAVGGPDPHLATLGAMLEGESWEERVWRCGCYAAGYNVPTAQVLWENYPWPRALEEPAEFASFIERHWAGFGLRRERRAVRTPSKFSRCLDSYAQWAAHGDKDWWDTPDFDRAWRETGSVYGLGRYVQLKLVEALCRFADGKFWQDDIRAQGGASPREGLALLYPQHADWLMTGPDDLENAARAERLAMQLRTDLRDGGRHLDVDWFTLQVVLCEYKKTSVAARQYPGRTHDTELKYWRAAHAYWGLDDTMLRARERCFPTRSLGEKQGWWGREKDFRA